MSITSVGRLEMQWLLWFMFVINGQATEWDYSTRSLYGTEGECIEVLEEEKASFKSSELKKAHEGISVKFMCLPAGVHPYHIEEPQQELEKEEPGTKSTGHKRVL